MSTGLDVEAVLRERLGALLTDEYGDEDWGALGSLRRLEWGLAAALRVEIESALADAWDEGWERCADLVQDGGTFKDYYDNPYRASLAATEGDRQ